MFCVFSFVTLAALFMFSYRSPVFLDVALLRFSSARRRAFETEE